MKKRILASLLSLCLLAGLLPMPALAVDGAAVKGGDPLSESEIDALIREMLSTGAPPTCPHGRPVVKMISRRDLEKMFKRIQ